MDLSAEQKQILAQKLASGAGVSEIQKIINHDFKIPMTYMETRFLIDDLDLEIVDPKANQPEAAPASLEDGLSEDDFPADDFPLGDGSVQVEVDRIKRPGAALSGTVTFSDGEKAQWYVDPYGRLGLDTDTQGYRPSPEDIQAFQIELQNQIGAGGM